MCGVVGWSGRPDPDRFEELAGPLRHRGPDDAGSWFDPDAGIWLGHRRLAVLDLGSTGHQPMVSADARYVISYNGEIYNHARLRERLEAVGHRFRGTSDTEVLLTLIQHEGLEAALAQTIGMFALALWDRSDRVLWLARDRLGVKPLYVAHAGGELAFASEMRPLLRLPWVDATIDDAAMAHYFRYLSVGAPRSAVRGVRKLPPGGLLRWDGNECRTTRWWDLHEVIDRGRSTPFEGSLDEATDAVQELLDDAVRLRMTADVPVGAFLSGGIDSSLVVATMQRVGVAETRTFTVGFSESSHDESQHARAIAAHLGTTHEEFLFGPDDLLAEVDAVVSLHDEPFADVSSLPSLLLARATRRSVVVALSGDGGDELWGGYPRYFWAERISELQRKLGRATAPAGAALRSLPPSLLDGLADRVTRGRYTGADGLASRVHRFGAYLSTPPERIYEEVVSLWVEPADVYPAARGRSDAAPDSTFARLPWAERMMAADQAAYLPDDILTKVDRTTMSVSLEAREPMLDHRLVELSWRMPRAYKLGSTGDKGKLLPRRVLARTVPPHLFERPKQGFGVPLAAWLRGPLRAWASDLLAPSGRTHVPLLDDATVERVWKEHQQGRDRARELWSILMFVSWRRSLP